MEGLCLSRPSYNGSVEDTVRSRQPSSCSLDFASISLGSLFIYVGVIAFCYLRLCADKASDGQRTRRNHGRTCRHPLHSVVWCLMMAQLLAALAHAGEALVLYSRQGAALPVTIAEAAIRLFTVTLVPVYFEAVERRSSVASVPLLMHSFGLTIVDGLRTLHLVNVGFQAFHLRLATTYAFLVIAASLFLLWSFGIASKVFQEKMRAKRSSSQSQAAEPEGEEIDSAYLYDSASFMSKLTFFWMMPLLRHGYREPLEMEDMKKLPSTERARAQYEKLRARTGGMPLEAILSTCLSLNWGLVISGGIFRLLADIFGFAGALSIKLIVDGLSQDFEEMDRYWKKKELLDGFPVNGTSDEEKISAYHALTIEEFFTDSYVVTVGIFIAALAQVFCFL